MLRPAADHCVSHPRHSRRTTLPLHELVHRTHVGPLTSQRRPSRKQTLTEYRAQQHRRQSAPPHSSRSHIANLLTNWSHYPEVLAARRSPVRKIHK
ncbi:hypothetical protein GCM10009534_17870 [Kribbella sandramycini]